MIKSININNFGIFKTFNWNNEIGVEHEFKKLNIIYGRNYSGKTHLARLLRCFEKECFPSKYENCEFSICLDDNTILNQTKVDFATHQLKIRVYNTDFIRDNLSWLHNQETGSILPFVLIGEQNIEIEKEIEKINETLGSPETSGLRFDLAFQETKNRNIEKDLNLKIDLLDKSLIKEAKNIKDNHKIYGGNITYDKSKLNTDILKIRQLDISNMRLNENDIDNLKKIINESPKDKINLLSTKIPNFGKIQNEVSKLLQTVTKPSEIIQELAENVALHTWVSTGITLHKAKRQYCGFCGNELTQNLWDKLDAHFIKENDLLIADISNKIDELRNISDNIKKIIYVNVDTFYHTLQPKFTEINEQWLNLCNRYAQNIQDTIDVLRTKSTNIFSIFDLPDCDDVSNDMSLVLERFNAIIDEHNEKSSHVIKEKETACAKLKLSRIANYLIDSNYFVSMDEINNLKVDFEKEEIKATAIKQNITNLELNKIQLESRIKDSKKSVALVNQYLDKFFNCHILLQADDEKKSFTIMRDNEVAHNLSEGECNLIAFCYFIAKLEDELNDINNNNKLIVYIDDPISSLDNNHIFFTYSLIQSVLAKQKKYGQMFISTHNLEFLKYIKKLTVPMHKPNDNSNEKKPDVASFLIERKSKSNSTLKVMPSYLKNYITEFNYLFNKIWQCADNNSHTDESIHYNFGNNLRKFLEAYLFFKYPDHSMKHSKRIRKFFDEDEQISSLIERLTNEFSHTENRFDRSADPIDINENTKIAKIVLEQIKKIDHHQYNALMNSINIRANQSNT